MKSESRIGPKSQIAILRIAEQNRPQQVAHLPHVVAYRETEALLHIGVEIQGLIPERRRGLHPLVELHAVGDPFVVDGLRGLVHNQMDAHSFSLGVSR